MLIRLALLLCALQWVLAAPIFPEPHFYSIDEVPSKKASSKVVKTTPEPILRRFVASSKALLDDLIGALTGQPQTPAPAAQSPFPTMSNSNSTNSTGFVQLRIRAGVNGTFASINGTSILLSNFTRSDPVTLAKRRMAIPKWTSPFANSKIVVESPRGRH